MNIDIKTADGADIELGGTYYDEKGTRYRVTGIRVPDHQALAKSRLYCIKEGSGPVLTNPGSLYLVSPDSLERLRDDLDRFVRNQVGDKIVFDVVTNEGYAVGAAARHPLNGATYRIDYILDDFEGLAQKYVALAISKED